MNALGRFLRSRTRELGISLSELARRSGKSRQTLHSLSVNGERLPEIETLIDLALSLDVHPMRLLHLVFDDYQFPLKQAREFKERGDKTIFLADVTIPDGEVVLAGSRFTKIWEVQNVGTAVWENRFLACMDSEIVVSSLAGERLTVTQRLRPSVERIAVPCTPPGDIVRMSVDFVAPSLPGTCVSYWKSVFADGGYCFPNSVGLTCKVRVISMRPTVLETSPTGTANLPAPRCEHQGK